MSLNAFTSSNSNECECERAKAHIQMSIFNRHIALLRLIGKRHRQTIESLQKNLSSLRQHLALSLSELLCQICPVSHSKCRKAGSPIYIIALSLSLSRSVALTFTVMMWVRTCARLSVSICVKNKKKKKKNKTTYKFLTESTILKFHVADSIKFIHSIWANTHTEYRMCIFV